MSHQKGEHDPNQAADSDPVRIRPRAGLVDEAFRELEVTMFSAIDSHGNGPQLQSSSGSVPFSACILDTMVGGFLYAE